MWTTHVDESGAEHNAWLVEAEGDYPEATGITVAAKVGQLIVSDESDDAIRYFVVDAPAETVAKASALADSDRPGGNASTEDFTAYRLAHGYSADELEGLSRNDLRDLPDR